MDIDRIADYLGTFYRPAEHPALDAQLRLWRETRPFAGAKLLDGTPVLDIKPYIPDVDAFPASRAGWRA